MAEKETAEFMVENEKLKADNQDLAGQNEILKIENEEFKERIENFEAAGIHDLTWYNREITRLSKELEIATADLSGFKERENRVKRERSQIKQDQEAANKQTLRMYNQSEHTRFRFYERPPRGLDVFGNPDGGVFDLGVSLDFFTGPVYIPAPVVIEMAQSVGMLTVDDSENLKEELAVSKAKNEKAALLATELTDGINSLTDKFYADLDSVVVVPVGDSSTESEAKSDNGGNDSKPAESNGQADGDNSNEKPDGVSSDSGDGTDKSGNAIDKLLGNL